eukprot:CAMPEP_0173207784 /NCGR_PEP_ID=MMETSP1141-20130122/22129_1 /TAXON_ID=483371 /ORGANISM="non described non described, Strain CCMP2298" /LENGTH=79 /DNA_ID=CAMNT_0014134115 /DNA_START=125 /DNA_END=361 /DNA_ORIENTATION=+
MNRLVPAPGQGDHSANLTDTGNIQGPRPLPLEVPLAPVALLGVCVRGRVHEVCQHAEQADVVPQGGGAAVAAFAAVADP